MIATGRQLADRTGGLADHGGRRSSRFLRACGVVVTICWGAWGCSSSPCRTGALDLHVPETTLAVAPALNFSGSVDFDPIQAADLMASELGTMPGIGIIGPNRVMAILAENGVVQVQSPEHAMQVCERLGADAILVFAITEYDPYTPTIGIVAHVYGRRPVGPALDPVAASRMVRPFPVPPTGDGVRPAAEIQHVFNGQHDRIHRDVREYARKRSADDGPYGWRKYLNSQQLYLRYCSYRVGEALLKQQGYDLAGGSASAGEEFGT